jgi:hypothetical protein
MRATLVAAVAFGLLRAATAEGEPGKIAVEFNDLQQAEGGCRAVFVLNNGLDKPLTKLALRVVAFDKKQHATLFLSLDVGALAVGKTRILRFDVGEGVACDTIGRLVLDDVTSCEGEGANPATCLAAVSLTSKAGVSFDF